MVFGSLVVWLAIPSLGKRKTAKVWTAVAEPREGRRHRFGEAPLLALPTAKRKSPLLPGVPGRKGGPKIDSVSILAFLGRRAGSVANWRHDTPGWHQLVPLRPSRSSWRC